MLLIVFVCFVFGAWCLPDGDLFTGKAAIADTTSLHMSTVAELKTQLAAKGLSVTGNKAELSARLAAAVAPAPAASAPSPKKRKADAAPEGGRASAKAGKAQVDASVIDAFSKEVMGDKAMMQLLQAKAQADLNDKLREKAQKAAASPAKATAKTAAPTAKPKKATTKKTAKK